MIEKLEQLTMAQFIDLICGNTTVLLHRRDIVAPAKQSEVARNIVLEYHLIADESGAKAYLSNAEDIVKAKMQRTIYTMCGNLLSLGQHDRVREVLSELDVNAGSMTDQRLAAEVKSRLERTRKFMEELENESQKETKALTDIRQAFDAQIAQLMAHYKFQIDITTIKATVYANLVARYNREIKAQIAAMNKNKMPAQSW